MLEALECDIKNINSSNQDEVQNSLKSLGEFLNGPLLPFVENLTLLISNHLSEEQLVRAAIVHIMRAFNIKYGKYRLIDKTWCSSTNLEFIHETISSLLQSENETIMNTAAYCIAVIAAKEIPNGLWEGFFPTVFQEARNKERGIYAVSGCILVLQELIDREICINNTFYPFISDANPDFSLIIENVFNLCIEYINDKSTPQLVLKYSLELFRRYFDFFGSQIDENVEIRSQTIGSLLECMKTDDNVIYSLCICLLVMFVQKHYYLAADKMQEIFDATMNDIKEGNEQKKIRAFELWSEIAKKEFEVSSDYEFIHSNERKTEEDEQNLAPNCYIKTAAPDLVPIAINMLREEDKNEIPEEDEKETVQKAALICLRNFERLDPENINPVLFNAFIGSIESEDQNDRFAAICALFCLLPTKLDDAVAENILGSMQKIINACVDDVPKVAENALCLLIELVTEAKIYLVDCDVLLELVRISIERGPIFAERAFQLVSAIESNFDLSEESNELLSLIDPIMEIFESVVDSQVFREGLVMTAACESINELISNAPFTYDAGKIFLAITNLLTQELEDPTRTNNEICISFYISSFTHFVDRFLNQPESGNFNIFFFIPNMIDFINTAFDRFEDVNIFTEGLIVADNIVLLLDGEEKELFAMQMLPFIEKSFDSQNNQVTSNAAVLLGDIFTVLKEEPEMAGDMFETISSFFNRDSTMIEDKVKLIICMVSIVRVATSFRGLAFADLMLKLSELSAFKYDEFDPVSKAFALTVYTTIMDSYVSIIDIYFDDDREKLENNLRQFGKIITITSKLMPITDMEAVHKIILYISRLVTMFEFKIGFLLQTGTPATEMLQFYIKNGDKEISKYAKSVFVSVMRS